MKDEKDLNKLHPFGMPRGHPLTYKFIVCKG